MTQIPAWRSAGRGSLRPVCHVGYIMEGGKERREDDDLGCGGVALSRQIPAMLSGSL